MSKDTIKEALADALERPETITVASSQRLGAAAFEIVWAGGALPNSRLAQFSKHPGTQPLLLRAFGC